MLHELVAVHLGHQHVGEHEVGRVGARELQRGGPRPGGDDVVSGIAEHGRDELAVVLAIVDDEHPCHGAALPLTREPASMQRRISAMKVSGSIGFCT